MADNISMGSQEHGGHRAIDKKTELEKPRPGYLDSDEHGLMLIYIGKRGSNMNAICILTDMYRKQHSKPIGIWVFMGLTRGGLGHFSVTAPNYPQSHHLKEERLLGSWFPVGSVHGHPAPPWEVRVKGLAGDSHSAHGGQEAEEREEQGTRTHPSGLHLMTTVSCHF